MTKVKIVTDSNNKFLGVFAEKANLRVWVKNWIENDDQNIEFWNNGNISFDSINNEINISGDNGLITLKIINLTIQ